MEGGAGAEEAAEMVELLGELALEPAAEPLDRGGRGLGEECPESIGAEELEGLSGAVGAAEPSHLALEHLVEGLAAVAGGRHAEMLEEALGRGELGVVRLLGGVVAPVGHLGRHLGDLLKGAHSVVVAHRLVLRGLGRGAATIVDGRRPRAMASCQGGGRFGAPWVVVDPL